MLRNLKQYLKLGLKLTTVHRILEFDQSKWLKPYIELNTRLRKQANSKFEKDFAKVIFSSSLYLRLYSNLLKLMNNSFFGKTIEDTRRYKDIKVVTNPKTFEKLVAKPTFKHLKIYDNNMAGIELRKQVVKLDKPR